MRWRELELGAQGASGLHRVKSEIQEKQVLALSQAHWSAGPSDSELSLLEAEADSAGINI